VRSGRVGTPSLSSAPRVADGRSALVPKDSRPSQVESVETPDPPVEPVETPDPPVEPVETPDPPVQPVETPRLGAPGTVTGFRDASLTPSSLGSEPTLLNLPP